MATAIRIVPTLKGKDAEKFEAEAKRVEENPGTIDFRHQAEVVNNYLKSLNW